MYGPVNSRRKIFLWVRGSKYECFNVDGYRGRQNESEVVKINVRRSRERSRKKEAINVASSCIERKFGTRVGDLLA